ncbi:MAG: VOC family protein, partial [Candidatus Eremiobacteraeota bacterium]|nr:VOC family protein [Candidatus Eremiobacteraeota bacterium]
MTEFRLETLSHVILGVADVKAAGAFYRDKLGLTVTMESPGLMFLKAGTISLMLTEDHPHDSIGGSEIVFTVSSVCQAFEELRGRGVHFFISPRIVT